MAKAEKKPKILLLLDTHALIHRAYHAIPKFKSKNGEPTGALYGLSTMVLRAIKDFKPDYIVAAYDLPGPTFRHAVYEEYKGKRHEIDEELIHQLGSSHDVIRAFGISALSAQSFEADDILGTLVEQTKKEKNLRVIIVSGDADTFQLVDGDRVVVYTMRKGVEDTVIYNEAKVNERFGFGPVLFPDYKGLRGDTSDNIVGVRGIGEKTAGELIKYFGSLEKMYQAISKKSFKPPAFLKERILELLKTHREDAFFSKTLATIRRDVPISFHLPKESYRLPHQTLHAIFEELGFNSLIKRLEPEQASLLGSDKNILSLKQSSTITIRAANGNEKEFWSDLQNADTIALFENENKVFIKGKKNVWQGEQSIWSAKKEWNKLLKKDFTLWDAKSFLKHGLNPTSFFDCRIAAWIAESTIKDPTPEHLSLRFLGKEIVDEGEFVAALFDIRNAVEKKLGERSLTSVWEDIELPLIDILASMEERGITIDRAFLERTKKDLTKKRAALEKQIYSLANTSFNINSPQQVGEILFEKLTIGGGGAGGKIKKTATGKMSTRESELVKLKDRHPVVSQILDYRELSKILTTYVEPLLELSQEDGKIHTTFNQTGTVTGRLSSDSPNLQNIPIRSDVGAQIRGAFVASPGYVLAAFDYSQIELRILASLARDEKMIEAFRKGLDIHALTASEINNVALSGVTPAMRMRAKTINFGIVYGMGVRQLAQSTGMTQQEATKFYEEYFHDFPKIQGYKESIKRSVRTSGFVETLFGRKRFFDLSKIIGDHFLESEMERMAVNAIIQGTDADIMKRAMIAIDREILRENAQPILQIHDEMIYEIPKEKAKDIVPKIQKIMESVAKLAVPLKVDTKVGERWGSMVK